MPDLITERMKLKDIFPDKVEEFGDVEFCRKGFESEKTETVTAEHSIISYISTLDVDRDDEVLLPKGVVLDDYNKLRVVLWAHDYRGLPIGKSMWIKKDAKGIISKTQYAHHEEAEKVYQYRADGFPLAESVGFIPLESTRIPAAKEYDSTGKVIIIIDEEDDPQGEWEDVFNAWVEAYKLAYGKKPKKRPRRIYTKWLLLEYSDVPVPANPEALQLAISKGLMKIEKSTVGEEMGEEEKPYENEHSCRLKSPAGYDRFRRANCEQKHDDKCIDVIYGIKDNKSEIQALRYKTDLWTESAAKAHCKTRKGTFEPASKGIIEVVETEENIIRDTIKIVKDNIKVDYNQCADKAVEKAMNKLKGRVD